MSDVRVTKATITIETDDGHTRIWPLLADEHSG